MNKYLLLFSLIFVVTASAQIETQYSWDYIPEGVITTLDDVQFGNFTKSTSCSNTSEGTIGLGECADIGTAAFGTAGITDAFDAEAGANSTGITPCGNTNNGSWHVYDLEAGVEQVIVDYAGGFGGAGGFSDMHMGFYQGPDCANLTEVDCGLIIEKVAGQLNLYALSVTGLDDSQLLWVYTHASKNFVIDFTLTGTGPPPANESCTSASVAVNGCNLGAAPGAFTAPSAALGAGACNGGTWYSNENTVFYTFTATSTSGTIDIDNLICNDGTAGEAQVGVWTDCASVGTYGGNYLGCSVGSGTLNLPALTIGNSYVIAVDGQAGDACTWDFTTTGVILSVDLLYLRAYNHLGENLIDWKTISEVNNDYFIVEKQIEGDSWEIIDQVYGAGTTNSESSYLIKDKTFENKVNYYRISQYDINGQFEELGIVYIDNSINTANLVKIVDFMGAEVTKDYRGPKILIYNDGTTEKLY